MVYIYYDRNSDYNRTECYYVKIAENNLDNIKKRYRCKC